VAKKIRKVTINVDPSQIAGNLSLPSCMFVYENAQPRCLMGGMSRKTILILGLIFLAVAAAIVITMASRAAGSSTRKDNWMLTVTLPATNKGAATQMNVSRPTN
jgi:hypothetical protein